MQNIFVDVKELERRMHEIFGISDEVMIENAASALENEVRKFLRNRSTADIFETRSMHRANQSRISHAAYCAEQLPASSMCS